MRFSGRKLRARREALGLRREDLACVSGRSYDSIVSYEIGRVSPPANAVADMAAALDCRIDDLFEEVDAPEAVA